MGYFIVGCNGKTHTWHRSTKKGEITSKKGWFKRGLEYELKLMK